MVKVFLVDDHEVVRRGLCDLLAADPELEIVGEAGSVAEAKARIPALRPDVAVLDVRLPDGNGIELCRDLVSDHPDLRCLRLTSFTSDEAMLEAILAGASGYVVKDIKGMELAHAIKEVGAGKSLLDNRAAAALMAKLRGSAHQEDPLSRLTEQERTLLGLLGRGPLPVPVPGGVNRRNFLFGTAILAVVAVAGDLGGKAGQRSRFNAEKSRSRVKLPKPASPAPALPGGLLPLPAAPGRQTQLPHQLRDRVLADPPALIAQIGGDPRRPIGAPMLGEPLPDRDLQLLPAGVPR